MKQQIADVETKIKLVELNLKQRELIDKDLHLAAIISSNTGKDSTIDELKTAHKQIKQHYENIKKTSPAFYDIICPDKEEKSHL